MEAMEIQPRSTAHVEVRGQHAKKGRSGNSGPDTYVAVQIVPESVEPLRSLNRAAAERRGIEIRYFGEGYSRHDGPRSALGKAILVANAFAAAHNGR